jgi:outer membrane biosynthesis protein TonB
MPLVIYIAVLIAALSSVLMGLDRMAAPPPAKPAMQAAPAEPIRHTASPPAVAAAPAEKPPQSSLTQQPTAPAPPPAQTDSPQQQTVSQSPSEAPAPSSPSAPSCNYRACENAYQSFRASDCTYQPYDQPRRLCTK